MVFDTYRCEEDLARLMQEAVGDFYVRRRALPFVVMVNAAAMDATRAAMIDLAIGSVPVATSGGILKDEVWLGVRNGQAKASG